MVKALDRQSKHLGVTRRSLIKMWIGEKVMINRYSPLAFGTINLCILAYRIRTEERALSPLR
jgi:isoprenylcysteine carboxyl methyltransferase (ICMT) family protein YpbQ